MDIYFAKINNNNNEILGKFHHKFSRIFLKHLLKNIYKIDLPILEDGKKPYIKSDLKFSISHSQKLLAIAFDKNEIGIDIEYKKQRDYDKILKYLKIKSDKPVSQEEFYKIWTTYEAEYKSQVKDNILIFNYKNYVCSVSSKNKETPSFFEVTIAENADLETSLDNNALIKKIEISASDFLPPSLLKI